MKLRRRTVIGSLILCLFLVIGGIVTYEAYDAHQIRMNLLLNCSTCDERKANQLRSRNTLIEQSDTDVIADQ